MLTIAMTPIQSSALALLEDFMTRAPVVKSPKAQRRRRVISRHKKLDETVR